MLPQPSQQPSWAPTASAKQQTKHLAKFNPLLLSLWHIFFTAAPPCFSTKSWNYLPLSEWQTDIYRQKVSDSHLHLHSLLSIGKHWESWSGSKFHVAHKVSFTAKEELKDRSVSSVSPLSFLINTMNNIGGYCDRENLECDSDHSTPGALAKMRGTVLSPLPVSPAQQGYFQQHLTTAADTAALSLVQPQCLMVVWHNFLQGSSESRWNTGIGMRQTGPLGLFSLISSFCQNYTWSCFVIVVSNFHLCLSNSIW